MHARTNMQPYEVAVGLDPIDVVDVYEGRPAPEAHPDSGGTRQGAAGEARLCTGRRWSGRP